MKILIVLGIFFVMVTYLFFYVLCKASKNREEAFKKLGKMSCLIIAIFFLFSSSGECATYSKYEWEAGRIYLTDRGVNNCVQRVEKISNMLYADGIEDFDICIGWYKGKRHRWIEMDGVIIDPSVAITDKSFYRKD